MAARQFGTFNLWSLLFGWAGRSPRPLLITAQGTGALPFIGQQALVAAALGLKVKTVPLPYPAYPAAFIFVDASVKSGRKAAIRIINANPGQRNIYLCGMSQGATVFSELWEFDIKAPNGVLHHRMADIKKAVMWGNPMREAGNAVSDGFGSLPSASAHGMADVLMVNTPSWWKNYAHANDMFTSVEGESGEWATAIYSVVKNGNIVTGHDALLAQARELVEDPTSEFDAMFDEILYAGMFFGSALAPHLVYNVLPAINYLRG